MRIPDFRSLVLTLRRGRRPEGVALFLLLIFFAVACLARGLNHDEQQFVASGALLSESGLLPYLDYPYFHVPNLVFVYAGLFSTNPFLLLTARSCNILCACLLLLVFFSLVLAAFRSFEEKRWPLAVAITLLFALNPLFRFTAGRAWNHDLPMLASVAAFAAWLRAFQRNADGRWIAASGALFGMAMGTRLTFIPLIIPFLALTIIFRPKDAARYRAPAIFLVAMAIALLPTVALFAAEPKAFLFDNFIANGALNLRFRDAAKSENVLLAKLLFPFKLLVRFPSNLLLVAGFAVFGCWLPLRKGWRAAQQSPEIAAILLIVPFALLGALLPTPSYRQYYSLIVPFLFLGFAFGIARFWNTGAHEKKLSRLLICALIAGFIELVPDLWGSGIITRPDRWAVWTAHRTGLEIQHRVGAGPVLTLAPIYPLEGGVGIYREFCTGPFAWRIAAFAGEADQARYSLVQADKLDSYLTTKPAGILTHVEKRELEEPLLSYARRNRYTRTPLSGGGVLWVRPADEAP